MVLDNTVSLLDLYEVHFQTINEIFLVVCCHYLLPLHFVLRPLRQIQGPRSDLETCSMHLYPKAKSIQAAYIGVSPFSGVVLYFDLVEVANRIKSTVSGMVQETSSEEKPSFLKSYRYLNCYLVILSKPM